MNRRPFMLMLTAPLALAACGGQGLQAQQAAPVTTIATATAAGASTAPAGASLTAPTAAAATAVAPTVAAATKLNLNTATREQLLTVPNAGDRMAREFLEYRPYRSIGQFRREIGKYVSQEQVTAYERYLFVPVDPNAADADTLQQLPGTTAPVAQQLIAARPFNSRDAFMARLTQLTSEANASAARAFLVS